MSFNYLSLLIKKEVIEILRDKSILAIAFILPILLVFIYGSSLRMDIKPVNMAFVSAQNTQVVNTIYQAFKGSDYFKVSYLRNLNDAQDLMQKHEIKAFVYLNNIFSEDLINKKAQALVVLNGTEAQSAAISLNYIDAIMHNVLKPCDSPITIKKALKVQSRNWFNDENDSIWFLMSGQYVAIITVMCVFLSSFVISREWDRQTIETLSSSNAKAFEIVLSKVLVYFALGLLSMVLTLTLGQIFYYIPIHGSTLMLLCNMTFYTLEMICLGVLISALCKNQFLSVEYAIVAGFLPAVMLSGLIFDLRGVHDFIRYISIMLPPTYAVQSNRIIFLSGDSYAILWRNIGIHCLFISVIFYLTVKKVARDIK